MIWSLLPRLALLGVASALYIREKARNGGIILERATTAPSFLQYSMCPRILSDIREAAIANYKTVITVGVNIAGFEFGCGEDGTCNLAQQGPPLLSLGGPDG